MDDQFIFIKFFEENHSSHKIISITILTTKLLATIVKMCMYPGPKLSLDIKILAIGTQRSETHEKDI